MKLAFRIVFVIAVLAVGLYILTTDFDLPPKRVQSPWQIEVLDPHRVRVMDVVLGETTLDQLRQRFGQVEGLALFRNPNGRYSLEAYLGKVHIGPLSGRWIVTLLADQDELAALSERSLQRIKTDNGSIRWTLKPKAKSDQADRIIETLTMIPDYSGMDAEFLRSRFGEPSKVVPVDDKSEQWLYPKKGLRILLNREGKDMFEYMPPAMMAAGKQPAAHVGENREQKP